MFLKHLEAAQGYLALDMMDEAVREIESIAPRDRIRPEVLGFRVLLYIKSEKWKEGCIAAQHMTTLEPHVSTWWQCWASCARNWRSPAEAERVSRQAIELFPRDASLLFNLGCLCSIQGKLREASYLIRSALELNGGLKESALDHPDLKAIRDRVQDEPKEDLSLLDHGNEHSEM